MTPEEEIRDILNDVHMHYVSIGSAVIAIEKILHESTRTSEIRAKEAEENARRATAMLKSVTSDQPCEKCGAGVSFECYGCKTQAAEERAERAERMLKVVSPDQKELADLRDFKRIVGLCREQTQKYYDEMVALRQERDGLVAQNEQMAKHDPMIWPDQDGEGWHIRCSLCAEPWEEGHLRSRAVPPTGTKEESDGKPR